MLTHRLCVTLVSLPLLYIKESNQAEIAPLGISVQSLKICSRDSHWPSLESWPSKQFDVTTAQTSQQKKTEGWDLFFKKEGVVASCIQHPKHHLSYLCRVSTMTVHFFWYMWFSFCHRWNRNWRAACGTWFWKGKARITLMSANLRFSFTYESFYCGDVPLHPYIDTGMTADMWLINLCVTKIVSVSWYRTQVSVT